MHPPRNAQCAIRQQPACERRNAPTMRQWRSHHAPRPWPPGPQCRQFLQPRRRAVHPTATCSTIRTRRLRASSPLPSSSQTARRPRVPRHITPTWRRHRGREGAPQWTGSLPSRCTLAARGHPARRSTPHRTAPAHAHAHARTIGALPHSASLPALISLRNEQVLPVRAT